MLWSSIRVRSVVFFIWSTNMNLILMKKIQIILLQKKGDGRVVDIRNRWVTEFELHILPRMMSKVSYNMVRAYYGIIVSLSCNNGLPKLATMPFFERMHVSLGPLKIYFLFFIALNGQ
jgi:hypothetical protein